MTKASLEVRQPGAFAPSRTTLSHVPNVGEPTRMSTTMSMTALATHVTYFACPGRDVGEGCQGRRLPPTRSSSPGPE